MRPNNVWYGYRALECYYTWCGDSSLVSFSAVTKVQGLSDGRGEWSNGADEAEQLPFGVKNV